MDPLNEILLGLLLSFNFFEYYLILIIIFSKSIHLR